MRIFYDDQFVLPLPTGHRFPMQKYRLLYEAVQHASLVALADFQQPHRATNVEILRAHDLAYLQHIDQGSLTAQEQRRIGFPWSKALGERERLVSGAIIDAARSALEDGKAINLAGGTHHAFRDHGAGYCVFNDAIIAARSVQAEGRVKQVVIIDCDVHQGDGTATIASDDPAIYTFSIHGAKNYPFHKQRSNLDIALDDDTSDDAYLVALEAGLSQALAEARAQLAIYIAGADPFVHDQLGRLALTKTGLAERDRMVLNACTKAGIPVVVTMAGGYARDVSDTVDIHLQTIRIAATCM